MDNNQELNNRIEAEEPISSLQQQLRDLIEKYKAEFEVLTSLRQLAQSNADQALSYKQTAEGYVKNTNDARLFAEDNSSQINNLKTTATSNAQAIAEDLKNIEVSKIAVAKDAELLKKDREESRKVLEASKLNQSAAQAIADIASEEDKKVKEYEKNLLELTQEFADLNLRVENLLPGATSAGLASAFRARKVAFKPSILLWGWVFILSIAGLVIFGFYMLSHSSQPANLEEWFFRVVTKSPILVALIVLEEFSRRHYNMVLRVEEDYAYKEVLSTSFDGYYKQMKEITLVHDSLAGKLSNNLLDALKLHPGRYIEKERGRITDFVDQLSAKRPENK